LVGAYVPLPNPAIPAKPLIELIAYVYAIRRCEISASVLAAAAWLVVESVGSGFPILRHYRPANCLCGLEHLQAAPLACHGWLLFLLALRIVIFFTLASVVVRSSNDG
jgi:hypothetical protein